MNSRLTILLGTASATAPWAEAIRPLVEDRQVHVDETASSWPFRRHIVPEAGPGPAAILVHSLHHAFPIGQTDAARLVSTQSTYQLQRWLDWLEANPDSLLIGMLTNPSPDVLRDAGARRGPWSRMEVVEVAVDAGGGSDQGDYASLHHAFRQPDPTLRYQACRAASGDDADSATWMTLASSCMETGRLDEAQDALQRALSQAPDWEAVHFELGKLWLWRDETERAAAAFAEAARLMPTFAAAHANLGAALGELERPEEALVALERAVRLDPFGHPIHNNIGASLRDQGRLTEAESSFRRVIELAPGFVFGHYNLGHVLFLQGRFADARDAYQAGLARDDARTPRQRARLALTFAALGDAVAAHEYARGALEDTPVDQRGDLLDEMEEVLEALTAVQAEGRQAIQTLEQVVRDYRSTTPRS